MWNFNSKLQQKQLFGKITVYTDGINFINEVLKHNIADATSGKCNQKNESRIFRP